MGRGGETLQSRSDLLLLDLGAGHIRYKHLAICTLKIWALSAFYYTYIKIFVLTLFKGKIEMPPSSLLSSLTLGWNHLGMAGRSVPWLWRV